MPSANQPVRVAIIGAGAVSDYHHVPGIALDPRAEVTLVCDQDPARLPIVQEKWGVPHTTTDPHDAITSDHVDALIIATPNDTHQQIAIDAARHGKHVMCEKPLALSASQVAQMHDAANQAGVVHMTAFTYRFAPSMRYLKHLVDSGALGTPRHFRSQRFLDLPETSWGWRQYQSRAGAGDLFDMTIHRIDFAMHLLGPLARVSGAIAQFAPRTQTADGQSCPPSDVDDWSCLMGEFKSGATGLWEGTTLAKGYHRDGFGHEWAEINGSDATAVYRLREPNTLLLGKFGGDLEPVPVPAEFLVPEGSPRSATNGDPATIFRWDLAWEFISAITQQRPAVPSFHEGLRAQIVADAVLESYENRCWIELADRLS